MQCFGLSKTKALLNSGLAHVRALVNPPNGVPAEDVESLLDYYPVPPSVQDVLELPEGLFYVEAFGELPESVAGHTVYAWDELKGSEDKFEGSVAFTHADTTTEVVDYKGQGLSVVNVVDILKEAEAAGSSFSKPVQNNKRLVLRDS